VASPVLSPLDATSMDNNSINNTGPRDVFLQFFSTILLYVGIFSFGNLLFQLINIAFPDPLNYGGYFFGDSGYASLRWPLSFLVIAFPAYIWIAYYIASDIEKSPSKKDLKTRRWLIYFTLFASAIAILIDLITLVYRFLGGELTTPFLLKVAVVLFMAISIFVYYRWILKYSRPALKDKNMRLFVGLVILIVLAAIIYGFTLMGSPFRERERRFDLERINALDSLQWQIVNYWQSKEVLPESLDNLKNPLSGFSQLPLDPETGESYEYRAIGPLTFELCATFKTSSTANQNNLTRPYGDTSWDHGIGRTCFERTIDPDLYPSRKELGVL